jgi:hypothetical protein
MHGCAPGSGGPLGDRNGNFKHGRFTREAKEVSKWARGMARDGETLLVTTLNAYGLKPPKRIRRRVHVKRALAKAKGAVR